MKTPFSHAIAAVLAVSAAAAFAQVPLNSTPGQTVTDANAPTTRPDVNASAIRGDLAPRMQFVAEPIASSMGTGGEDKELVDSIVTALNGDTSLKDSKVTVSADKGTVTLTGATQTREQAKKIGEIATAQAGEGKVVNVVVDSVS